MKKMEQELKIKALFEEVLKHHVKVAGLRAVYRRHLNDIMQDKNLDKEQNK